VMSAVCPIYPQHQTFPSPIGASHLEPVPDIGPERLPQHFHHAGAP
jgi:hypothetical protein